MKKLIRLIFSVLFIISCLCLTVLAEEGYVWPMIGYDFGRGFTWENGSGHNGIDITNAPTGDPIYAVMSGEVVCSSTSTPGKTDRCSYCQLEAGYHILVKQTDGLYAVYAHLSDTLVKKGDTVTAGQKIGKIGNTGNSTGPHLHLSLFNQTDTGWFNLYSPVDPLTKITPFCKTYVEGITKTNAKIYGTLGSHNFTMDDGGVYIGTSPDNMTKITENIDSGEIHPYTGINYDLNKWGVTLKEGTTYYYQLWISRYGKEYKSNIRSFKTKGHTHTGGTVEVTEATCTEEGRKIQKCTECGETLVDEYISALGHKFDKGIITKKPTATSTGKMTYTCLTCGEKKTETLSKLNIDDYNEDCATIEKDKVLKGTPIVDGKLDDVYTESLTVKLHGPAESYALQNGGEDTTATGTVYALYDDRFVYVFYDVTDETFMSGDAEYVELHAHPHLNDSVDLRIGDSLEGHFGEYEGANFSNHHLIYVDAHNSRFTCYEESMGDEFEKAQCKVLFNQKSGKYTVEIAIPVVKPFKEGDIIEFGFQINDLQDESETFAAIGLGESPVKLVGFYCGGKEKEAHTHTAVKWITEKEATCSEDGKRVQKCTECGEVVATEIIAKGNHKFDNGVIIAEATETEEGKKLYTCANCQYAKVDTIPIKTAISSPFTDVPETEWYHATIITVYENKLMMGNSLTTFNPTGTMTIAEAITIASRIHHKNEKGEDLNVLGGANWYDAYVNYAIENGIIKKGDFSDYSKEATRGEMAYIFSRSVTKESLVEINKNVIVPDVYDDYKYANEIKLLYKAGVVAGSDEIGRYYPERNISRAEVAMIVARLTNLVKRVEK